MDWQPIETAPKIIRVSYEPIGANGVVCAYSADLKGFRIHGISYDELHEDAPAVASALVREVFGVACEYSWFDDYESLRRT